YDRAGVAARMKHLEQARRTQARMFFERLLDECLVGVEQRGPNEGAESNEAVGLDGGAHRLVVHAELGGDRAELPVLGEEEAANLGAQLVVDHRATSRASSRRRSRKSRSRFPSLR